MSIKAHLAASFAAVIALFALNLGVYSWGDARRTETRDDLQRAFEARAIVSSLANELGRIKTHIQLLCNTNGSVKAAISELDVQHFEERLAVVRSLGSNYVNLSSDRRRPFGTMTRNLDGACKALTQSWSQTYTLLPLDQVKAYTELVTRAEPLCSELLAALPEIEKSEAKHAEQARILSQTVAGRTREITFAILFFTAAMALVVGRGFAHKFNRAISTLQHGAERISQGDLTYPVVVAGRNELSQLAVTFDAMRSSLLEAHSRLEHQARHDALTGLANRLLFHERLRQAIEELRAGTGSVALLYIDCDNFKTINDSLGHDAGDLFLKQRAECLGSCLRPGDTLARLGGDEFAIVLPGIGGAKEAINVGHRILSKLGDSFKLMGQEVFGSASIGVHCSEGLEEVTAEAMLRDADTAMYHVKAEGKAGVGLFNQSMKDRVNEQMEIEAGLQRALERNELYLVYQPLVDLNTGDIVGAEALLRWSHPERGNISPGRFIPIAEESGLIVPIGAWVLEQACRQTLEWRTQLGEDTPFKITVNISGKQFQRPDAEEVVLRTLSHTGLPAKCLELEITETVMLKSLTEAGRKANSLRKAGIRLALDDFGTGYSSMASLIELPVDTIKIDRTFINRMSTLEQVKATVAAIIALAKAYGMDVIAEGIESEGDVSTLQGYGCNFGQGYYFAKPIEAEQMSELLARGPQAFARKLEESHSNVVEELLEQVVKEQRRAA